MCLNHPTTIPPTLHGKIVFYKSGTWCQKGWGLLPWVFAYPIIFIGSQSHYKVSYDISLNVPSLKYLNNSVNFYVKPRIPKLGTKFQDLILSILF